MGDQEATVAAATVTWLLKGEPPETRAFRFVLIGEYQLLSSCRWSRNVGEDSLRLAEGVNSY